MYQSINGNTIICGNDYPFCYDQENEKIIIYLGMKPVELPDNLDKIIGQRFGMISGGNTLYKLSVPLSNDGMIVEGEKVQNVTLANQVRTIEYLIDDYQLNSKYTEMRLQFPELDYFIPSRGRAIISQEQFIFSRINDAMYSFDIHYRDTVVNVSFNSKVEVHVKAKTIAETISEVTLKFHETDEEGYLLGLYTCMRNFFCFICNRSNIGMRSAILIGKFPHKTLEDRKIVEKDAYTKQKLVLNQKYLEPLEEQKQLNKVPNSRIFSTNLKELVQLFFEEKIEGTAKINGNSIHPSFKYRNLIDLEQSLHITAAFEYYVRTVLPEISSAETLAFFNDIEILVDEYIKTAKGKMKEKAKKFKKLLRPQVSLEEKILKAYEGYSTWKALKPILIEWFGDNIADLASSANLWRNELAHEKREYQPDINVIKAIRLVEHINYCIVLRLAGYDDEQIKIIVAEILTR